MRCGRQGPRLRHGLVGRHEGQDLDAKSTATHSWAAESAQGEGIASAWRQQKLTGLRCFCLVFTRNTLDRADMACRTNRTGRSPAGLSPGTRTPLKHDGNTYSPDLICKECGGAVSRMHAQAFRAPPLHLTYASSPARVSASNGRWSERAREGHAHRHRQRPLFCEVLVYGFRHSRPCLDTCALLCTNDSRGALLCMSLCSVKKKAMC